MLFPFGIGPVWIKALTREIAECLSFRDDVLLVSIQFRYVCNLVTFFPAMLSMSDPYLDRIWRVT